MKYQALTLAAGMALIGPAALGLVLSGVPTFFCPFPALTILPAFVLGKAYWLAVMVPTLLFFAWNPGLFRGEIRFPTRTIVLLVLLTALSGLYFVASWKYGVEYQGAHLTRILCLVNGAWLLLLWVVLFGRARKSSFTTNLVLHWMLFAWLAWYAFPYLGELP